MVFYVNMHDKFLSGWGGAAKGRSLYSIKCETLTQAEAIVKAAEDRSEMRRITIASKPPKGRPGDTISIRDFADVSGPWKKYYNPANEG